MAALDDQRNLVPIGQIHLTRFFQNNPNPRLVRRIIFAFGTHHKQDLIKPDISGVFRDYKKALLSSENSGRTENQRRANQKRRRWFI